MGQISSIQVLASDRLPLSALPDFVGQIGLAAWLEKPDILWEGVLPLCALVSVADMPAFRQSALAGFLAQTQVVVIAVEEATSAETLANMVFSQVLLALDAQKTLAHELRSEAAQLRQDYMKLQQTFNVTEDFLYNAFAPSFTCARHWETTGETVAGKTRQRLPIGSPGLVAVDIWAGGPGRATLRLMREIGADFAPVVELSASEEGWIRALLPRPLEGLAEDVMIEVEAEFSLGLSLPTPLSKLHASGAEAPLALRIWRGLPGVRLPNMQAGPARHIIPVSNLPEPEVSGGTYKPLKGRDAVALHPGHDGKMAMVIRGLDVPAPANIAAYMQNFGPETVRLSLAVSDDARVREVFLPPESHVQVDVDVASAGVVDLHFKLRAPSPVVSVYLRGIEICPITA